jgi:hypothetical protein
MIAHILSVMTSNLMQETLDILLTRGGESGDGEIPCHGMQERWKRGQQAAQTKQKAWESGGGKQGNYHHREGKTKEWGSLILMLEAKLLADY